MRFTTTIICVASALSVFAGETVSGRGGRDVKRVAIIGAGAAGTSTSYHLEKYLNSTGLKADITIFERSPYIGGRSTTVTAFNHTHPRPDSIVELGASIFVSANTILTNATSHFKLSPTSFDTPSGSGPGLGIWNSEEFVFTTSSGSGWWDLPKLVWRYGLAPVRTARLRNDVVGRFLKFYEGPTFPFASLTQAVYENDLKDVVGVTGEQFLQGNGIGDGFAEEIIQASTRVNYAQNLPLIHGLETMVCMATEGAMSISGGNWQIFDRMANTSATSINLETAVTSLSKQNNGTYVLRSKTVSTDGLETTSSSTFDTVILAAPYQFADIDFNPKPQYVPDEIPYVNLHVTLFTSPHSLAPAAFNMNEGDQVPKVVLTTLLPEEHPGTTPVYAGKAGFFSISTLRLITNPHTGGSEYLYKIFSPAPISNDFLTKILGISATPESSYRDDTQHDEHSSHGGLKEDDVSWIHRKLWQSYPYEYPRVTFEELRLDENLWYTAGIESFISTMETSALMGMNVAKLVVDEWLSGKQDAHFENQLRFQDQKAMKAEL